MAVPRRIIVELTHGAVFGLKASLVVFGTVFVAVYGLYGGAAVVLWVWRGRRAAERFVEDEGGLKSLLAETMYSALNLLWLTICCTLVSAVIFAIAGWLSLEKAEESATHPLDRN